MILNVWPLESVHHQEISRLNLCNKAPHVKLKFSPATGLSWCDFISSVPLTLSPKNHVIEKGFLIFSVALILFSFYYLIFLLDKSLTKIWTAEILSWGPPVQPNVLQASHLYCPATLACPDTISFFVWKSTLLILIFSSLPDVLSCLIGTLRIIDLLMHFDLRIYRPKGLI